MSLWNSTVNEPIRLLKWHLLSKSFTALSRVSTHGRSQFKPPKNRVGSCMEEVRTLMVQLSLCKLPTWRQSQLPGSWIDLHCHFACASSRPAWLWRKVHHARKTDWFVALLPSLPAMFVACSMQIFVLQAWNTVDKAMDGCVWKFAAGCRGTWSTSEWLQLAQQTYFRFTTHKFILMGCYTEDLIKPQNCQNWWVGACTGMGTCLEQYGNTDLTGQCCLHSTVYSYTAIVLCTCKL